MGAFTAFNQLTLQPGHYTSPAIALPPNLSFLQADLGITFLTDPAVKVEYGFEISADGGVTWNHCFGAGLVGMTTPPLDRNGQPITISSVWKEFGGQGGNDWNKFSALGDKIRAYITVAGKAATIGTTTLRWG